MGVVIATVIHLLFLVVIFLFVNTIFLCSFAPAFWVAGLTSAYISCDAKN